MPKTDFVNEMIEEITLQNPEFPSLIEAADRRRRLFRALAECREAIGTSQTRVAATMKSSQSSVARLEGTATDARLSSVDRYAAAIGYQVQWHLVPLDASTDQPPVVVHSQRPAP